jgi:hypothetical protein
MLKSIKPQDVEFAKSKFNFKNLTPYDGAESDVENSLFISVMSRQKNFAYLIVYEKIDGFWIVRYNSEFCKKDTEWLVSKIYHDDIGRVCNNSNDEFRVPARCSDVDFKIICWK